MITWTIYNKENEEVTTLKSDNPKMIKAWCHQFLVDLDDEYILESIKKNYNVHLFPELKWTHPHEPNKNVIHLIPEEDEAKDFIESSGAYGY